MVADLYDATTQLTRAAGNWGKKGPPKIPLWPRPGTKKAAKKAKPTVADLFARFNRDSKKGVVNA